MQEIILTKGQVALVDDEDFDMLDQFKWHAHEPVLGSGTFLAVRKSYVHGRKKPKTIYMHKLLMNATNKQKVNHRDRNTLNNQKENLRKATRSQTSAYAKKYNSGKLTSKYVGVCWSAWAKKWSVKIWDKGKRIFIGYFDNEDLAAEAYKSKAIELKGEFANTEYSL